MESNDILVDCYQLLKVTWRHDWTTFNIFVLPRSMWIIFQIEKKRKEKKKSQSYFYNPTLGMSWTFSAEWNTQVKQFQELILIFQYFFADLIFEFWSVHHLTCFTRACVHKILWAWKKSCLSLITSEIILSR